MSPKLFFILFLVVVLNLNCAPCDDENYTRDEKEKEIPMQQVDSLEIVPSATPR